MQKYPVERPKCEGYFDTRRACETNNGRHAEIESFVKLLLATKNMFSISCTEIANSSLFSVELSRITFCMILSTRVFLHM